ncbi:hypothetical protein [Pseudomonas grimontii]|uniref:hypothetical protein n=1 Tax=Pseudomonas grimontii TaxID=129847 RepID=UPI00387B23B7
MKKLHKTIAYKKVDDIKKLQHRTRNQVRAMLSEESGISFKLLNSLRKSKSISEILQIEKVIRGRAKTPGEMIPELFPESIQTKENYLRLCALPAEKQIEQIERLTREHIETLTEFKTLACYLSDRILSEDFEGANEALELIHEVTGSSNFILRKAALIHTENNSALSLKYVDTILEQAGLGASNLITSSLINSYKEEQEILSLKRSIMNLADRGARNKYTRDIARIPLHPHAKDLSDLGELIQSCLQSSLIDALIIIKINRTLIPTDLAPFMLSFFDTWDSEQLSLEIITEKYCSIEDGESIFYKRSSAWLENKDIIEYRILLDHFYDDPDAEYFDLKETLIERIDKIVTNTSLENLSNCSNLTHHSLVKLRELENNGFMTRTAVFNFLVHKSEGNDLISESSLFEIMSKTYDLDKTTNASHLKTLATFAESKISKIIYYLLIARRSRNEGDDHQLRRILQQVVIDSHGGDLVNFVKSMAESSSAVAKFTYAVCVEDFIAKLVHIIKTSAQITETRAALHKWMGETTGEKSFLDRARTLIIDHQINRVRNELDDHRIYVDAARFSEWFKDELIRELDMVLTSMEHNHTNIGAEDGQLLQIVENAYESFCSNSIFGIASYLGRRIRHGTFKGHLYFSVVAIESADWYAPLFRDANFSARWTRWKKSYETSIDSIINDNLHIESTGKRNGLLKPNVSDWAKMEIAIACAKNLVKDFIEHNTTIRAVPNITEYCWRIAEVDLKNINTFLKNQRSRLMNDQLLSELRLSAPNQARHAELQKDFNRDLVHMIDEKLLAMYGWFKRPLSASPKASLPLLYKAVVAEVKVYFTDFDVDTEFEEAYDIQLVGGPYHVIYDALYVIVYNAAKHGKPGGEVYRDFKLIPDNRGLPSFVCVTITSQIRDSDTEQQIREKLEIKPGDDIDNAQLSEGRSGIRKLHQLQQSDPNFKVESIICENRTVSVSMSYALEHL